MSVLPERTPFTGKVAWARKLGSENMSSSKTTKRRIPNMYHDIFFFLFKFVNKLEQKKCTKNDILFVAYGLTLLEKGYCQGKF